VPAGLKRGVIRLRDGARIDWLQVGWGPLPAVIVPGAGDGLWTVGQTIPHLLWRYRRRVATHRLLILGRREPIPPGFGIAEHADDYIRAAERLRWQPSVWECMSAGGPIGQQVARRRPDLVQGLILASTMHRSDETLRSILRLWRRLIDELNWAQLYWSIVALNRRPATVARYRSLRPLLRLVPPPGRPQRLVRLLDALTTLDQQELLPHIVCPSLIIGGEEDRIISAALQREMAALIPQSRLILYPGYGHAAPDEHPAYEAATRRFIEEVCC
jgi:pimeloyl-ACP methyl ester carboxylesterase